MKFMPQTVTRNVSRSILTTKKNSPHIFFIGGVAAILTGVVLACKATLSLEETLDEIKSDVDNVKHMNQDLVLMHFDGKTDSDITSTPYTNQEFRKDMGYVYLKGGVKLGRLYGPALIIGGVGITAITGSHIQMTKRNTALTMTLAAVSKAFDQYRERVRDELGEERELEIHRAISDEKIGKEVVKVTDPNGWSPYAKFFDEGSPNWVKNAELNRIFLTCQQNFFNDYLQAKGHLFLNEVYDALGIERTQAGAVVGWVISDIGDNYVDFGMYEAASSDFINGLERSVILDFNVDGVIYDKIKE